MSDAATGAALRGMLKTFGLGDFADVLESLLSRVTYKDGWTFGFRYAQFQICLAIVVGTADSLTGLPLEVCHLMPIPTYVEPDERTVRRWLLDCIFAVEQHEAMEFFKIDGEAPYFPDHERAPYAVTERDEPVRRCTFLTGPPPRA